VTDPLRFAVVGSPVAHSKSPAMHAAAYDALGLPHTYEKLETNEAELASRIAALRDGTFAGLNVTVPHKISVLGLVDEIDHTASAIGAANTLVRTADGTISAYNTDARALEPELATLAGTREVFTGKTAIVLGTGGVARAAVFALHALGVRRIIVRGRSSFAAAPQVELHPLEAPAAEPPDVVAVVQATSCGMTGGPPGGIVADAVAWATLSEEAVAYDVIYTPRETPFLQRARARGLHATHGLGMLARQGALAFELWLGIVAPLDAMLAAIEVPSTRSLASRES
jgi:shikimate dehydrogenase